MQKVSIRKSTDWKLARELHDRVMPDDSFTVRGDRHLWIAYLGSMPIGYAIVRVYPENSTDGYFSLCGVVPEGRGLNVQKKLIRARCAWLKRNGYSKAITYTIARNPQSINNLIACGFKSFEPVEAWVGRSEVLYWWKTL